MWGLVISASAHIAPAQVPDLPLSNLNVGAHDPLYTTYAAPLSRSEYLVDEGYFLNYFSSSEGVTYATDTSGSFALGWRLGKLAAFATRDFYKPPVIHRSYSDLVELEYWPFTTIQVRETLGPSCGRHVYDKPRAVFAKLYDDLKERFGEMAGLCSA